MFYVARLTLLVSCLLACFSSSACSNAENCVAENSWQLGVAVGGGVKTNPLEGGDNIPLILIPDIAWYGEKAYFDNTELGYQWIDEPSLSFETFLLVDTERAFFSSLHPANVFVPISSGIRQDGDVPDPVPVEGQGSDSPDSAEDPDETDGQYTASDNDNSLSIESIKSRNWAINGGARVHYFVANSEFSIAALTDVSGGHKGQQIDLNYKYRWKWRTTGFNLKLGANWKSANLIDHYYGVGPEDTKVTDLFFSGEAGWQPYLNVNLLHPINKQWMWIANAAYRKLPDSLYASPLIKTNQIKQFFLGVAYRY